MMTGSSGRNINNAKTRAGEGRIEQLASCINVFAHTVPDCFGICNVHSVLQRKAHQPITWKQLYEFRKVNEMNYFLEFKVSSRMGRKWDGSDFVDLLGISQPSPGSSKDGTKRRIYPVEIV